VPDAFTQVGTSSIAADGAGRCAGYGREGDWPSAATAEAEPAEQEEKNDDDEQ
jgi:hypothetical protein